MLSNTCVSIVCLLLITSLPSPRSVVSIFVSQTHPYSYQMAGSLSFSSLGGLFLPLSRWFALSDPLFSIWVPDEAPMDTTSPPITFEIRLYMRSVDGLPEDWWVPLSPLFEQLAPLLPPADDWEWLGDGVASGNLVPSSTKYTVRRLPAVPRAATVTSGPTEVPSSIWRLFLFARLTSSRLGDVVCKLLRTPPLVNGDSRQLSLGFLQNKPHIRPSMFPLPLKKIMTSEDSVGNLSSDWEV